MNGRAGGYGGVKGGQHLSQIGARKPPRRVASSEMLRFRMDASGWLAAPVRRCPPAIVRWPAEYRLTSELLLYLSRCQVNTVNILDPLQVSIERMFIPVMLRIAKRLHGQGEEKGRGEPLSGCGWMHSSAGKAGDDGGGLSPSSRIYVLIKSNTAPARSRAARISRACNRARECVRRTIRACVLARS